jgi:hypothetical protein
MEVAGQCRAVAPGPLWSHLAGWDDLPVPVPATDASGLDPGHGWPDRWRVVWLARKDWAPRRGNLWHELACPGRLVRYTELRKLLIEHGNRLAKDIDYSG